MENYQVLFFIRILHLLFSNAISVESLGEFQSFKTTYGEIYDCVDIYRQPALNHPLLKNHKIQMRPKMFKGKEVGKERKEGDPSITSINVGMKFECPLGTVPIRRATKEERIRANSNFIHHFQPPSSPNGHVGLIFAGISTGKQDTTVYYGAEGYSTISNPIAGPQQLSGSVISIEGGPNELFSVIRVGWMVNLDFYKDNQTRLVTLWGQMVGGTMRGCYNTYCPGFVQTNPSVPLDMVLKPVSVVRGPQYYIKVKVDQEKGTGKWWLMYGESDEQIGYWPSELFVNLKDGANVLRWGGIVYSDTTQLPQMGNGDNGNIHSSKFMRIGLRYEAQPPFNGSVDVPIDVFKTSCYKAGDNAYKGSYWGYSFYYGGEGGDAEKCSR